MRRGEENQRQGGGKKIKSDSRIYTPGKKIKRLSDTLETELEKS